MCSVTDDPSMHDVKVQRRSCEASVGRSPSPYGEVIVRCHRVVGVTSFTDAIGMVRYTCAEHRAKMQALWGRS